MPFDVGGITLSSPGTTLSMDNGATPWMKVDANGILTRSQTPYMRGDIRGQSSPYNAGGTPLKITADENIGNCWNNATGLFTCPVSGYYMAIAGSICGQQAGYLYVNKNGSGVNMTHWNHMGSWHYVSLSAIISAAANDTLSWTVSGLTPSTTGVYGGGSHAMYSIALLP